LTGPERLGGHVFSLLRKLPLLKSLLALVSPVIQVVARRERQIGSGNSEPSCRPAVLRS
jgi:hypothetical protein